MEPPHAVLVDVGDTLLEQRWFNLADGIDAVVHDRGRSEELADAFRAYELPAYARGDECLLGEWLRLQGPSLAALAAETIEDSIWDAVVRMQPRPGVEHALARLTRDGMPLAAVSNAAFSGRLLRRELARHGLAAALQFVLSSADVRSRKPSPEIFRIAIDKLGHRTGRAWFVGDTFDEDIVGAKAAGMQPIWLPRVAPPNETDSGVPVVKSWIEFLDLYSSCVGGPQERNADA
jgi:HAD superfamily hydrolase (TIGR01509 family)